MRDEGCRWLISPISIVLVGNIKMLAAFRTSSAFTRQNTIYQFEHEFGEPDSRGYARSPGHGSEL